MRKLLAILLLIIPSFILCAQGTVPPVYQVKNDTSSVQTLAIGYYQVLEDKKGSWTFEQVSNSPLATFFHHRNASPKTRDTLTNTYWFRYKLKNAMNKEIKIALKANIRQTDFYISLGSGLPQHYLSGWGVPWSKKDGYKKLHAVPFTLSPGMEIMVYQRISDNFRGIPPDFKIEYLNQAYIEEEANTINTYDLQQSLFIGIFFLAACFNLLFFWIIRERVYLYLSLFLFLICLNNNPVLYLTVNKEHPSLYQYIMRLGLSSDFFFLHFLRHYFQTFVYTPRWDKAIIIISAFCLVCIAIILYAFAFSGFSYTQMESVDAFMYVVWVLVMLCLLISPLLFIRKQKHLAKSFMIALAPLVLLLAFLTSYEVISAALKTRSSVIDGARAWVELFGNSTLTWAVLYFTWILFKRYDRQKKEIAEQAIQVERLEKERERERSELIAGQKVVLEKEVAERTAELSRSLFELKSTQSQLIQSEKMASLGELTAGIAHEIQNPLNFVNNFSELSAEIMDELEKEIVAGNQEEGKALATDIKQNLEKILHHGKRADAIVKGMLQHTRNHTGKKEPTNINALAEEYLRLAYHGLRAKDKMFEATIETNFDNSIGEIDIIPQDIGRVILNLINNAFYATSEKKKGQLEEFEPVISVFTRKIEDKVSISVKDNGNGIPQQIADKIFQPFFTTKPPGQGTGLGLSLSYDIIKAHGGELQMLTKEGEGSEFVILLPN